MKLAALAVSAAALVVLFLPPAHADECLDKAVSQPDMNACAKKAYTTSDVALNKLYQQILQRLKDDADAKKRLLAAQRAWLAFRDAECHFSASATEGGTVFPMAYGLCLDSLTKARVQDFKLYLSCQEGDASCPLPPGK